ncbi:MAG: hypothetical protein RL219_1096 [Actinomycetota bacterium]
MTVGAINEPAATTSGDTYYACAAVNGMIRPSWIRLNTAPAKCPVTTDHIVQWAAGGQPISPKAGIVIPLEGPLTLTRPQGSQESSKVEWPAVDTSMSKSLAAFVKYSGTTDQQASTFVRLTALQRLAGDTTNFGEMRADVAGDYGTGGIPLGPGAFTASGGAAFAAERLGAIVGPSTAITAQLYTTGPAPALTLTIDQAWLYCTPY